MQLNIGEFGGVQKSEALSTGYTIVAGPQKNVVFAEKTQKFARTGLAYVLSFLNKSGPPLVLQEAHDDNKSWFGGRQTTSRFGEEFHENICTCGASRGPPGAPAPRV